MRRPVGLRPRRGTASDSPRAAQTHTGSSHHVFTHPRGTAGQVRARAATVLMSPVLRRVPGAGRVTAGAARPDRLVQSGRGPIEFTRGQYSGALAGLSSGVAWLRRRIGEANRRGNATRRMDESSVVEMQVTRQHVVDILRRTGLLEVADEATRVLPDPVDLDYAVSWCARRGVTHDDLVNLMGGSP